MFRTASFRLAALYTVLFTVSALLLSVVIFWIVRGTLDQQIRTRIMAESAALQAEYDAGGVAALVASVRTRELSPGAFDYLVQSPDGTRLAGNLPTIARTGWIELTVDGETGRQTEQHGERPERIRVLVTPLAGGLLLAVGDDLSRIAAMKDAVIAASSLAVGLVVLAGILGGGVLSRAFLRRVDTITSTAQAIIDGDMQQRIPLRGTDDYFDQLAAILNKMLDRISALMGRIRNVSGAVAHDLRTPIARVYHDLDAAQTHAGTPDEFRAAMENAKSGLIAALETFSALLRIAEIEAGTRRSRFRRLDMSAMAIEVADAFAPSIEEEHHGLHLDIEPGIEIEGDRELLTQLLANLLENAMRHTPPGCEITISLRRQDQGALLVIEDDGPGVPDDERSRIFEPYYRGGKPLAAPGSGLGLSLVAAITELHHAALAAHNARPGLRVEILFPRVVATPRS